MRCGADARKRWRWQRPAHRPREQRHTSPGTAWPRRALDARRRLALDGGVRSRSFGSRQCTTSGARESTRDNLDGVSITIMLPLHRTSGAFLREAPFVFAPWRDCVTTQWAWPHAQGLRAACQPSDTIHPQPSAHPACDAQVRASSADPAPPSATSSPCCRRNHGAFPLRASQRAAKALRRGQPPTHVPRW